MNSDPSKLRHQHQHQEDSAVHHAAELENQQRDFSSVEELIRYDSEQTPVPKEIAARVNESIGNEAKPARPWWRRLFS